MGESGSGRAEIWTSVSLCLPAAGQCGHHPARRDDTHAVIGAVAYEHVAARVHLPGAYTRPLFQLNISTICGIRSVALVCQRQWRLRMS
jgi:hypothetical protein